MATNQTNQTNSSWAGLLITALIALGLGVFLGMYVFNGANNTCTSVGNFNAVKAADRYEVNLTWTKENANDEHFFIVLQDLDNPGDENLKSFGVSGDRLVLDLNTLKSNRRYRAQLFRVCDTSATNFTLSIPTVKEFNTLDWVVIEDIVHLKEPTTENLLRLAQETCEALDTCDTVSLDTINRFGWTSSSLKEYYKISITREGTNEFVTALLEKDFSDSQYKVRSHLNFVCGSFATSPNALVDTCAGSPIGTFCNPTGSSITYTIGVTRTHCTVNVGAGYSVRVERCE